MIDFDRARTTMVDCQIMPNGVTRNDVLEAFLLVPREAFVPAAMKALSYIDEDIEVADNRYLMEAMSLAKLIQLAEVQESDIVLDVGCATGYSTALLARLASSVVALECDEALATSASANLAEQSADNAVVVTGPLEKGYAKEGPYDVIFVGGAMGAVPDELLDQLKVGGRLVGVVGQGNAATAVLYTNVGGVVGSRSPFNSAVAPLPGFEVAETFVF